MLFPLEVSKFLLKTAKMIDYISPITKPKQCICNTGGFFIDLESPPDIQGPRGTRGSPRGSTPNFIKSKKFSKVGFSDNKPEKLSAFMREQRASILNCNSTLYNAIQCYATLCMAMHSNA